MSRLFGALQSLLSTALIVLLIAALVGGGLLGWIIVRSFPERDGTVRLPGLAAEVTVMRDSAGVAHVYAASARDLFAAQGYVHASERMWQMEVWRRVGAGRLAEIFGASEVETDRFIRTLGWRPAAEADVSAMSPPARLALEAYAEGVNAWLDQHGDLPLQFVVAGLLGAGGGLAGYRPEPWTAVDSLTWVKVMAWSLGGTWSAEVFRSALAERGLSEAAIAELLPDYDAGRPIIVGTSELARPAPGRRASPPAATGGDALLPLLELNERLLARLDPAAGAGLDAAGLGSNGWAVAPARSATGAALLANDPHLGMSIPSLWYLVGLHCEPVGRECPYDVVGAGFPGVPGIVLGHNARIAWGLTNLGPDVQDLFEETLDPRRAGHYLHRGRSVPFDVRDETIRIAGGEEETVTIRRSVHGPLLSDVAGELRERDAGGEGLGRAGHAYALAWPSIMEPDRTFDAVLGVNRAANWTEFRNALRDFVAPSQAFLYADVDGHIGLQVPGRIPLRAAGDGSVPSPGEDGSHDWTGWVAFDELPSVLDPPSGLIVTANNAPTDAGYGHHLGRDWDPGYRAERALELLEQLAPVTADELRTMQADVALTRARPVIEAVAGASPETADGRLVRDRIRDWRTDLRCGVASIGCAAYESFTYRLLRGVFDDELAERDGPGTLIRWYVGSEPSHEAVVRLLAQPDNGWWDDTTTAVREDRDAIIARALDEAGADLRHTLGDPPNWSWGRIHTVTLTEETFGRSGIGPLEAIFNRGPFAAPGSCTIVNKICGPITREYPAADDGPADLRRVFAATSHPSYRLVIEMSDLDGATILHATGQSGLPFDAHYEDLIERWLGNAPLPLPFTREAVEAARWYSLSLTP